MMRLRLVRVRACVLLRAAAHWATDRLTARPPPSNDRPYGRRDEFYSRWLQASFIKGDGGRQLRRLKPTTGPAVKYFPLEKQPVSGHPSGELDSPPLLQDQAPWRERDEALRHVSLKPTWPEVEMSRRVPSSGGSIPDRYRDEF